MLVLRQARQPAKYLALDRDVVAAVLDQARELLGRDLRPVQLRLVFALARLARAAQLQHQPRAVAILLHRQIEQRGHLAEFAGQAAIARHRHGADVALDRHQRPAVARQHVLLDRALEWVVVRGHEPRRIVARREEDLRDGRARSWDEALDRPVVDRVADAQYPRRRIGRIAPRPHFLDGRGALRLVSRGVKSA